MFKPSDKIYITIDESNAIDVGLEVNHCLGEIDLMTNQECYISLSGCTKECCDSEFSDLFKSMLNEHYSLDFKRNKLILFNDEVSIYLRFQ